MKKEVLIAIIAGITLGLVISFGIATAQRSLKKPSPPTETEPNLTPSVSPQRSTLFVNSPQPNAVVNDSPYLITGSAIPGSMIAIQTSSQYISGIADDQGNFALSLELNSGANLIVVTAFSPTGQTENTSFKIAYQSAPEPTAIPTPTKKSNNL